MATDDFNRADAGTLGANWTNLQGSIDIVSNQAKTTAAALERAYYTGVSAADDQYSQVVAAGVGANGFQGPMVRASDVFVLNTSGNAYFLVWASSGASQGLYKLLNGVTSLLQSITGALTANDLLKIIANSNVIQCFKNGTQLGTDQTDGSLASGSPGIYNTQNASLQVIFDDWEGGDLVTTRRFFLSPG